MKEKGKHWHLLEFAVVGGSIVATEVALAQQPYEIQETSPATTVTEWMAQIEETLIQVTGVRVNPTEQGLLIVLETAAGELSIPTVITKGNRLTASIPNAVLALPKDPEYRQDNPAIGISQISITRLPRDQVQVEIIGTEAPPTVTIQNETAGLVFAVDAARLTTSEDEELEVTVTAEKVQVGYTIPNASTATRTDTSILDTPQSVQVVPQEVLRDQQILRVDDALQNVSGIVGRLDSFGSATNLTIRGFTTETLTGGAILRDGFRVTNTFGTQETANLERIEVIKGPSSVLYGQSDPGGIVNLVTKQPWLNSCFREVVPFKLRRVMLDKNFPPLE